MAIGIKVWDQSGGVVFDSSISTAKLLGSVYVDTLTNPTGSVTDGRLSQGTPFYYFQASSPQLAGPTVSMTTSAMSWSTESGDTYYGNIFYGVY